MQLQAGISALGYMYVPPDFILFSASVNAWSSALQPSGRFPFNRIFTPYCLAEKNTRHTPAGLLNGKLKQNKKHSHLAEGGCVVIDYSL